MFKDEYLLDFINTENLGLEIEDIDERVVEQEIVRNIRDFILQFGKDFIFMGNQYRVVLEGEEMFIDLLFFSRELAAMVAVELKYGKFKPSYLGQLCTYISTGVRPYYKKATRKSFYWYCVMQRNEQGFC